LAALSDAVSAGDPECVLDVLGNPPDGTVGWIEAEPEPGSADVALGPLRGAASDFGAALLGAAAEGDPVTALRVMGRFRVLCAHRRGPAGVEAWTDRIEAWLAEDVEGFSPQAGWYVGRPVMITANDYSLRLFNGDTGTVVLRPDGSLSAVFDQGGRPVPVSPSRLSSVETVFATTVHKSQGSEFDRVAVLLPSPASQLLTRELLYTAVTRARSSLLVVGTEASVRAAVERRVARTSGLAGRLRS
jgi:exodeoxyribonuclease V alpha subunit